MKLADIRDYLKGFDIFENHYIGSIDAKKKNSLGVYNAKREIRHKAYGGNEKYGVKSVSLLIHGDTNKDRTESLAFRLYEKLDKMEGHSIGEKGVYFIELLQDEPVDVDKDDNAIYEYMIELNIYYEKGR